jgi:hypothetical protein
MTDFCSDGISSSGHALVVASMVLKARTRCANPATVFVSCYCAPIRNTVLGFMLLSTNPKFMIGLGTHKDDLSQRTLGILHWRVLRFQQRIHPSWLSQKGIASHAPPCEPSWLDCIWSAFLRWFRAAASMWNYLLFRPWDQLLFMAISWLAPAVPLVLLQVFV